jgi:hypothetical protein
MTPEEYEQEVEAETARELEIESHGLVKVDAVAVEALKESNEFETSDQQMTLRDHINDMKEGMNEDI